MSPGESPLIDDVERYYSDRVTRFGATPEGVDWNGAAGQRLRFERLLAVVRDEATPFSINDYGCGYGGLLDLLHERGADAAYTGFDVSRPMIEAARERYAGDTGARFIHERGELVPADYTVASGIFNVRMERDETEWSRYVVDTLADMVAVSRRGVAFNALTSHSDREHMRGDLHYADPAQMLEHCLRTFSRNVTLDHDYELYEFTVIVRLDGRSPASQHTGDADE